MEEAKNLADKQEIIKGLEWWVKHQEGEVLPLAYSAVVETLKVLKEQEVAYQGAVELLRQKTILFDDAIKRLKEQEAEIRQLKLALDIAKGTCNGIIMKGR